MKRPLEEEISRLIRRLLFPPTTPLERAAVALVIAKAADRVAHAEVARARAEGVTWREVGEALGTNRQAAHERFGRQRRVLGEPSG